MGARSLFLRCVRDLHQRRPGQKFIKYSFFEGFLKILGNYLKLLENIITRHASIHAGNLN